MSHRKITIRLDEETARWARIEAARRETSVSSLIGELLREHMLREGSYGEAMERYLAGRAVPIRQNRFYPSRE